MGLLGGEPIDGIHSGDNDFYGAILTGRDHEEQTSTIGLTSRNEPHNRTHIEGLIGGLPPLGLNTLLNRR